MISMFFKTFITALTLMQISILDICSANSFTTSELRTLVNLQESYCGSSVNPTNSEEQDPWFCVPDDMCQKNDQKFDLTKPLFDCLQYSYNGGARHCCHAAFIKNMIPDNRRYGVSKIDFSAEPRDIGNMFINLYLTKAYTDAITDSKQIEALRTSQVCGLIPTEYKAEQVRYVPMVCTTQSQCDRVWANPNIPEALKRYYEDQNGKELCEKSLGNGYVCCHPAAAVDDATTALQWDWEFPVLSPDQTYVKGFRSSFQCEQYAKYVCEGVHDKCPVLSNEKGVVVPGEFPHQALIGIKAPRLQFFHCSGSIVSRFFILSTEGCLSFDGITANVALTGDFNLWQFNEDGSHETLSYIIQHIVQHIENGGTSVAKLILFKLWRPLNLNYLVRPACVNNLADLPGSRSAKWPAAKLGTFSGFGMTTSGRWGEKIRKFENVQLQDSNADQCKKDIPTYVWQEDSSYCYLGSTYSYPTGPWGPCQIDLGAPLSVQGPKLSPYCTWKVFAVSVSHVTNCEASTPALFTKLDVVVPWIEQIIFEKDFYLPTFDVSWPSCDLQGTYRFQDSNLVHLRKSYNPIYPE